MFHVPGLRNTRHGSKLHCCWLAGTVSEKVFKRKINNHQITEHEIKEYCEEILQVFNDKRVSNRWHFGLNLFSHLMFGVVKLYSYQFVLFENSVFRMLITLNEVECGVGNKSTERREKNRGVKLTKISQIPIDELLMPLTPELNLNRPLRRDMNLLYEISPASHRRMIELDESHLLRFSPLTGSQAKLWLSNDEGCLWSNMNCRQLPESERRPDDVEFVHLAAKEAAQPDLSSRIFRTPTKRTSTQKNVHTPSKRQRSRRIPQTDMDEERTNVATSVFPMEQDDEPFPLPVQLMLTEAPGDLVAPVDPLPTILPMEQDVEPHLLPEHQVVPVDSVPVIFPMQQDVESHPLPKLQLAPIPAVNLVKNATTVKGAVQSLKSLGFQRKKEKIVDAVKSISEVKLKQRQRNVEAYTESASQSRSVPTKMIVRTVLQLPSMIFKFGMENIRYDRLRKMSDELLRRHGSNIYSPFVIETDSSNFRPRDLPRRRTYNALTILDNVTDLGESTENSTVIQPIDLNIALPDELQQAKATDEPAFDIISDAMTAIAIGPNTEKPTENRTVIQLTKAPQAKAEDDPTFDPTSGIQLLLGNIDHTGHSENTSDTITASFKRVQISTNSARSKATDLRRHSFRSDWTMYSPRFEDHVTVEKCSKLQSSEEFVVNYENDPSSPRSGMGASTVWTRKDLEAILEVHWHDSNIISFEHIAPPNHASDVDAIACFMLLLDMYKENKIILTQARSDAPIHIEKGIIPDAMDWN